MNWENIRIVLGIIFLIGIFGLLIVLIPLAYSKKKFLLYAEQIKRFGKIEKETSFIKIQFDFFLASYIFSEIPSTNQRPDIYQIKEMTELKDTIDTLSKIAKPLAIGMGILVVGLIVLLNLFEK
ncbi:MAG: hypothetical protein IPO49_12820 [Bacteroidetes bacterium]|nr:hypothetical protein [Bacteroidota bacterium]